MSQVQRNSRVTVQVDASPQQVWDVICDVTRVGEWSHECRSGEWLDGASRATVGARFRGRNRTGLMRWSRICELVTVDPPRRLEWRTVPTALFPDSTRWSIELESGVNGTVITQSFAVLTPAPRALENLYVMLLPAHQDRDARLTADLARLGTAARAESRA